MKNKIRWKIGISELFPIAFFAVCWAWMIGLTYYTSGNILDADASNVLVLSRFLAQQNAVLSPAWRYYTELHVLNMQLVYAFFFKLFTSWRLVRFFGAVTLQAILVASYGYFCKQAGFSKKTFFYSAAAVILPVSVTYARIVLFHAHYAFHIALAFLIIGLLIRLANKADRKKAGFYGSLTIYLFLCLISGTNGMRQLYISLAPVFLICLILYLRSESFRQLAHGGKADHPKLTKDFISTLKNSAEGRGLFYALAGVATNVFGIAINLFVLRRIFAFSTYYSLHTFAPEPGALNELINDLLNLFGFRDGARLFSPEGVCSLLAIVAFAAAIGFSIWYVVRSGRNAGYEKRIATTLFFSALILQSLVFLITSNYYIHYYTPVFILAAPLIAAMLEEFPKRAIRVPRIVSAVILAAFFISGAVTTNYLVNKPESYATKYEGLSYSNIDLVEQIKPAAEFLEENGFTFGYSYYWNSSVVTELTDGKVEVCAIVEPPALTYSFANTKKAFWNIDYHQGKTFFLFEASDTDAEDYPALQGGTMVYQDAYYKIYEYPGPICFPVSPLAD